MGKINWNEIVSGNIEVKVKKLLSDFFVAKISNTTTVGVITEAFYKEWNSEYKAYMEEDGYSSVKAAEASYSYYEDLLDAVIQLYKEGHSDNFLETAISCSEFDSQELDFDEVYSEMSREDIKADIEKVLENGSFNEIGKKYILEKVNDICWDYTHTGTLLNDAYKYEEVYDKAFKIYKSEESARYYSDFYIKIYESGYYPDPHCESFVELCNWAKKNKEIQTDKDFKLFQEIIDYNPDGLFPWCGSNFVLYYSGKSVQGEEVMNALDYIVEVIKIVRANGYPATWRARDKFALIDSEAKHNTGSYFLL